MNEHRDEKNKPEPTGEWIAEHLLPSGERVRFRHVSPADEPLIVQAISTASRETLLHRFFSPITRVPPDQLRKMLAIDRKQELCLVGVLFRGTKQAIICGARYVRSREPSTAEFALTVHDDFQRAGLGSFMLELLAQLARKDGIRYFEADVMASNLGMRTLLKKRFPSAVCLRTEGDVHHYRMNIE